VDAVAFTHEHADHLHGLDDLRLFPFTLGHPVPLYCEMNVEQRIKRVFDYAFSKATPTHPGGAPQLSLQTITTGPFEILGAAIIPIRLLHGPRFQVLGFRVGNVAYCTDVKSIPDESIVKLQNLDTLVLGALRCSEHPTHMSVDEAIALVEVLRPKMTYLTHTSHELEYEAMNSQLPANVKMAYDGLKIKLS
jgi:phosphoribosyl 1,2-cyclic phosphate phosphodiesterase